MTLNTITLALLLLFAWCNLDCTSFQIRGNVQPSINRYFHMSTIEPDKVFPLGKFAFSLLPLSPESVGRRKTILSTIVPDRIWTLDQVQGIINVNVPVRCTVIKLKDGLFINNPVAPTKECIEFIRELEDKHGSVRYITLSSLAIEHKGTIGVFASYFPKAQVYAQPGQYSFPVNLPIYFFFPFGRKVYDLPSTSKTSPWNDEIEHLSLGPLRPKGVGGFGDTAFFHKSTKTLLVTDVVVRVDDNPPAIIEEDPRALLYHSRDSMLDEVNDTKENRIKGWRRMVLFALVFQPAGIKVKDLAESLKLTKQVSSFVKSLGEGAIPFDGGLYPWDWIKSEIPNFRALQGSLLVAPILQKLILNREPEKVMAWVDEVCKWDFKRIIPCHLANDLKASPQDFRDAFDFLYEPKKESKDLFSSLSSLFKPQKKLAVPLEEDLQVLNNASIELTKSGVLFPEGKLLSRR